MLARVYCLLKTFETSDHISSLVKTLEGSIVTSDFMTIDFGSNNDFEFIANDLRKFGRRTKMCIVFD